ncbi:MAG TPA: phosphoribosylglycinamide formyltransferase [Candidatus Nanoarchaeia archaeon]|nr:phosphoribosylglycinamide formyltransferase [Candidatus Nanoarchaeia archaeon]
MLGSTKGTDLEAVIDAIQDGSLSNVKIAFVLSNKKDAYILERSRKAGIESIFLDPIGKKREDYDKEVDRLLEKHNVDLVILIGYMKLMSSWFVRKWRYKVMNIHPSLLPKYAGGMDTEVHAQVLKNKDSETGCSLIFIDEGADTGPIILQKKVKVTADESVESLKAKVQKAEQKAILHGIKLFRDGRITVGRKKVMVS